MRFVIALPAAVAARARGCFVWGGRKVDEGACRGDCLVSGAEKYQLNSGRGEKQIIRQCLLSLLLFMPPIVCFFCHALGIWSYVALTRS